MGFDNGRITLDSENSTYYAGQTVFGKLEFQQEKLKTFRGIYIQAHGFAKVHWTTDHTRKVNDRTQHYKKNHNADEEYFSYKHYLIGSEHGEHKMQPSHQSLPFQFHIPPHCPSSFEGKYGHIRYEIKIVVDRAFKVDQEKKLTFRVVAPVDLNQCPQSKNPVIFEFSDSYCCWCVSAGESDTLVKIPVSGFVPGQTIPIEVNCENKGNVDIANIKIILRKKITFHAHKEPGTKHEEVVIAQEKRGEIKGNSTRNWMVDMEVPTVDTFSVDTCKIIDIDYEVKVKVCPSGCHSDSSQKRKIQMGTVPMQGMENRGPNPLHTPMPVPIMLPQEIGDNQHSFNPGQNLPYPGANPPYPGANPPYHGSNPPYPGANPPYPGANPPYPGANPPYPGANPPYAGANPPYPGANAPYPGSNPPNTGANPPYPGANLPYPGTNPPNTGANLPYPGANPPTTGANPPYPGANTPYPGANPPYPASNMPYPTSPGFKVDLHQRSSPQMPMPGNQNTSTPWSQPSATAPEPSTPIGYEPTSGKPFMQTGGSSPYNPEFMK